MRSSGRWLITPIALLVMAATTSIQAHWISTSAQEFTYCAVTVTSGSDDAGGFGCTQTDFGDLEECIASCGFGPLGPGGPGAAGWAETQATPGWTLKGGANVGGGAGFGGETTSPPPGTFVFVNLDAELTPQGGDLYSLSGTLYRDGGEFLLDLAVLRFTGDPADFDGLQVTSVLQLVELGLIAESDILFLATEGDIAEEFLYELDLSGVAENEIVLFAVSHAETVPIPATSTIGLVLLAVALFGAGTLTLLRRRRA